MRTWWGATSAAKFWGFHEMRRVCREFEGLLYLLGQHTGVLGGVLHLRWNSGGLMSIKNEGFLATFYYAPPKPSAQPSPVSVPPFIRRAEPKQAGNVASGSRRPNPTPSVKAGHGLEGTAESREQGGHSKAIRPLRHGVATEVGLYCCGRPVPGPLLSSAATVLQQRMWRGHGREGTKGIRGRGRP